MSSFSSQPPTETMAAIFEAEGYDTNLDHAKLAEINAYFRGLKKDRAPRTTATEPVDAGVLEHKIPGGMISNLRSQLDQQGALDRLQEVMDEHDAPKPVPSVTTTARLYPLAPPLKYSPSAKQAASLLNTTGLSAPRAWQRYWRKFTPKSCSYLFCCGVIRQMPSG